MITPPFHRIVWRGEEGGDSANQAHGKNLASGVNTSHLLERSFCECGPTGGEVMSS